jgi:hypothetical protein
VEKVLEILPDNTQLRQAVIAKLTERVLDLATEPLPTLEDSKRASLSDGGKGSTKCLLHSELSSELGTFKMEGMSRKQATPSLCESVP